MDSSVSKCSKLVFLIALLFSASFLSFQLCQTSLSCTDSRESRRGVACCSDEILYDHAVAHHKRRIEPGTRRVLRTRVVLNHCRNVIEVHVHTPLLLEKAFNLDCVHHAIVTFCPMDLGLEYWTGIWEDSPNSGYSLMQGEAISAFPLTYTILTYTTRDSIDGIRFHSQSRTRIGKCK